MTNTDHITALLTNARQNFQRKAFSKAYDLYLQLINLVPTNTMVLLEMGQLCATMGKHAEAANTFQRAIELEPNNATCHYMRGALYLMHGSYPEAIDRLKKALLVAPDFFDARKDLGTAHYHLKQFVEAAEEYEICLNHQPDKLNVVYNLGLVRKEQRRYEDAELLFRKALSLAPDSAEIHSSLGHVLKLLHKLPEAEEHIRTAIKLKPGLADAHFSLGKVLLDTSRYCDAERSLLQALKLNPQHKLAEASLACVLSAQGEIEKSFERNLNASSKNDSANAHSNLLFGMHYRLHHDKDAIFNEHQFWCEKYAKKTAIQHDCIDKDPEKTLRVGYLSANFYKHSVAYFLEAIFRNVNNNKVEIYCYSDSRRHDVYTDIFQEYATEWRDIFTISNEDLVKQIKNDKIDVLVDLAGHTDKGYYRLGLFAMKPAPVQVTYLGYPDTTGLDTMDYRLTDRIVDPLGSEKWHSEALAYLETGFLCYTPSPDAPPVASLPATKNNYVTFGSFNTLVKISPETLDAWIKILQRVPNSRLLIKAKSFSDPELVDRYRARLLEKNIDISRFDLIGWEANTDDHLSLYGKVDIGLDPFPYNGTTTTCEALWMGVPVVTLMGDRHCGRVGESLMTTIGLTQLIASDVDDYIDKAAELAGNFRVLSDLRMSLRERMANSNLLNGEKFTHQLEDCYRGMWRTWCEQN